MKPLLHLTLLAGLFATVSANGAEPALKIGIFPRLSAAETMQAYKPIADYLGQKLQREVQVTTAKDFPTFWQEIEAKSYDVAHYNQYHYVISHAKQGYLVIAKNQEQGADSLAAAIYVRKDSGIADLAGLKAKKIAFAGDPKAMMSYIAPTYLLLQAGLKKGDYEEIFAKNPPNALFSTFYKQADAAGVGEVVIQMEGVKKKINTDELQLLAKSEGLAHLPWVVKGEMAAELRGQIQAAMLSLNDSEAGKALLKNAGLTAIVKAEDSEYQPHREMIKAVLGETY
jgi:phosphonate transport system substrate-binding protein